MAQNMISGLRKLISEPLVHFLVAGAVVFAAYGLTVSGDEQKGSADRIEITDAQIDRALAQFERTWRRPPTSDELDATIDALVHEEILVREAVKLGMDQDDTIIRRRLAQKMEFLLTSLASTSAADDEKLRAFYEETSEAYATPRKVAFESVFLGETAENSKVEAALAQLQQGTSPENVGANTLLPSRIPLSEATRIDATFGQGFADAIATAETGAWSAPIQSAYGFHLVRVTDAQEAQVQPFETVRDQVAADWQRQRTEELSQEVFESLRSQYQISRADTGEPSGAEQ